MSRTTMIAAAAAVAAALCLAGAASAQMAPMSGAPRPMAGQPMPGQMSGDPMTMPTMAPDYVKAAGAGDKFEIDSSRLILKSTKNAKIRSFATKMIADHTKSTMMVKMAARKDGVMVMPAMLTPDQMQMMSELQAASPKTRDMLYMRDQKMSHQMALQVQQSYANGGDKPALMAAAGKIVPVVQGHIDMLNDMPMASTM